MKNHMGFFRKITVCAAVRKKRPAAKYEYMQFDACSGLFLQFATYFTKTVMVRRRPRPGGQVLADCLCEIGSKSQEQSRYTPPIIW